MASDPSRSGDPTEATADGTDDVATPVSDPTSGESADERSAGRDESAGARAREVVVPDAVYKRVTVFSTLFAVAAVVGGFLLLDVATDRATAELSEVQPLVALAGLGLIAVGAVTYAFSTRFRADGMGNAKDETDDISDNG
jgi:hypothetical protein